MLKSLSIENLRGIRSCHLSDTTRINLFVGKNNVGKSTILDALFILAGQSNPELPLRSNRMRDFGAFSKQSLGYIFYNCDDSQPIRLSWQEELRSRELRISAFQQEDSVLQKDNGQTDVTTAPNISYGLNFDFFDGDPDDPHHSQLYLKTSQEGDNYVEGRGEIDKDYKERIIAKYLSAHYRLEDNVLKELKELKIAQKTSVIVGVLRQLDDEIRDIEILGDEIYIKRDDQSPLMPVNFYGDGLRKLLGILVSIYECREGMLLIDEMDNGFHYSFMPTLWQAVFRIAQECDTQLFVTTHSADLLKGLMQAFGEAPEDQEQISTYKVIRQERGFVKCVKYDYSQLDYSLDYDIEIR